MSQVRIKLLQEGRNRPIFNEARERLFARYTLNNNGYLILPRMDTHENEGFAAEEMFDLTNNPSREEERQQRYGNGRSVSSGDIVEVDGVDYLCCSIGWKQLNEVRVVSAGEWIRGGV